MNHYKITDRYSKSVPINNKVLEGNLAKKYQNVKGEKNLGKFVYILAKQCRSPFNLTKKRQLTSDLKEKSRKIYKVQLQNNMATLPAVERFCLILFGTYLNYLNLWLHCYCPLLHHKTFRRN